MSSAPEGEVPAPVRRWACGRPFRLVGRNRAGGLTYEVATTTGRAFIKWTSAENGLDFRGEAERLRWSGRWITVPTVLDEGADRDGAWMAMSGLPGENAVTARWLTDPRSAVRAIAIGLRSLHDSLPVDRSPFSWSTGQRVADAHRRAHAGHLATASLHAEYRHLDLAEALRRVEEPPAVDRLVVCHGDACAPNTLIDASGDCSGHVDLGSLGTADRWADLAVASWSADWNYGLGWGDALLAGYGVEPDPARLDYYRLLYDLGP